MKNTSWIIAALVIAIVIFSEIGSNKPVEEAPRSISQLESFKTYGQRGVENTWPDVGDEPLLNVASNLTAANYYLVIDGSGSMADSRCSNGRPKIDVAKESLIAFIKQIPEDANVGIYAFDNAGARERLALGNHSVAKQIGVINSIRANGGTPLSHGVVTGHAQLTAMGKRQLGYGEYHLVVVTDGEASTGYSPSEAVDQLLIRTPINLHTIGFCIDGGHSLNRPGYVLYKAADDPESLNEGLASVLAEAPVFDLSSFDE